MIPRRSLSRLTAFERFLSVFTSVRPGEGGSVRYLFSSAFVITFAYYLLKPVREALLLSEGDAELGAYMDGAVAVTLIFMIPLYKQLYRSLSDSEAKSRMLRWTTAFFVFNLLVFYALGHAGVAISVPFYVWLSIFNVMVVAQFWAFAADIYNTKSGQRLFVVIMVGSSIGAWAGAQTAEEVSSVMAPHTLMLMAACLLVAPILMSIPAERKVPEGSENHEPAPEEPEFGGYKDAFGGFDVVFRSHYLIALAGFMFLLNMISSLGKYLLRSLVKEQADLLSANPAAGIDASEYILQFFGDYNAWIALIGLILQLFVVSRVFRYLGVRAAILILPVFMVVQFGVLALVPAFALVRISMIGQNAVNYSIQNTLNQALYLPLDREQKYVGKTTIDTFFVRFGDFAQGVVVFGGVHLLGLGTQGFIVLTLALTIVMVFLGLDLSRSHRKIVADKLANVPPTVVAPLPNVEAPAGRLLMFSVPDQCFFDPDPGDTLEYTARLAEGAPLPCWIRFDRFNQTFTLRPPAGEEGVLSIEVTAADFDGRHASGRFQLSYGAFAAHRLDVEDRD
jgi:AAA family ATP:ADP antiporter